MFLLRGGVSAVRPSPPVFSLGGKQCWDGDGRPVGLCRSCNINSQAALVRLIRYHEGEYVQLK